jgi:hypothetical protein
MSESGLRDALLQALVAMEAGPGAPCQQAQADGFPCPELGYDCTDCDFGREALLAWIAENDPGLNASLQLQGGDW